MVSKHTLLIEPTDETMNDSNIAEISRLSRKHANTPMPIDNGAIGDGAMSDGAGIVVSKSGGALRIDPPTADIESAPASEHQEMPKRNRSWRRTVLIAGAVAALGAAMFYGIPAIFHFFRYESTDDAFINGHVTYIAPRIAGRVTEVLVDNNQYVEAGQVLVRIDREPFQIVVDQKRAALAQARQTVDQQVAALDVATAQARQARDQARGQLAAVYADWYLLQSVQTLIGYEVASLKSGVANWKLQQANLELAKANLKRGKELVPQSAMSHEEFEPARGGRQGCPAASRFGRAGGAAGPRAVRFAAWQPARRGRPTPACPAISTRRFRA